MKKVLAIILVFTFVLSLAACGEGYTLEGKWKAPVTVVGADTQSEEHYMLLEFKANGSGTLTEFSVDHGLLQNFTYTADGNALTVTSESGKIVESEYEISGNILTISTGYRTVEYKRLPD